MSKYSAKAEVKHGSYFEDGKRRADYVLVLGEPPQEPLFTYLTTLTNLGLELESFQGIYEEKIFILIHIPQTVLEAFSKFYDFRQEIIDLPRVVVTPRKCFTTSLTQIPVYEADEFTSANRIILIRKILEDSRFGPNYNEFGLTKLMLKKKVEDAYPLHDGASEIEDINITNLNDRQLLLKSWANFRKWYKEVPLDHVQKYFGCDIAFYFAWLEFFNLMLLPAALIGFLVFLISVIVVSTSNIHTVEEVCNQNLYLCPACDSGATCTYKPLSFYCEYAKWNYVFDNYFTIAFAVFMSSWAAVFLKFWKRKQNKLRLRWNIQIEENKYDESEIYAYRIKETRLNNSTGNLEPYIHPFYHFLYITCATSACVLLILMVVVSVVVVVFYRITVPKLIDVEYENFFSLTSSSLIQVIVIKLLKILFDKLSVWLTVLENPRTQCEFDNSVLHKRFLLTFANNYAVLVYIALVRGHHFKRPRDRVFTGAYEKDTCQPFTCIVPLCVQLTFLMVFKNLAGNILALLFLIVKKCVGKLFKRTPDEMTVYSVGESRPCEEEYRLICATRYLLMSEFCEMIIEYGFIISFVAAFPLAPLIALVNNILEHRFEAIYLVTKCKRPLPRITQGIGEWDRILTGITYLSTIANAFVLAFTSDFVGREAYRGEHSSLEGYVNSTLVQFTTKDNDFYTQLSPKTDVCYYNGKPSSDDPKKDTLSEKYWKDFTWRLIYVVVLEHIIFVSNAILSYAISSIPSSVHTQLDIDKTLVNEAKFKLFKDDVKVCLSILMQGKANTSVQKEHLAPGTGKKEATDEDTDMS